MPWDEVQRVAVRTTAVVNGSPQQVLTLSAVGGEHNWGSGLSPSELRFIQEAVTEHIKERGLAPWVSRPRAPIE